MKNTWDDKQILRNQIGGPKLTADEKLRLEDADKRRWLAYARHRALLQALADFARDLTCDRRH